MPLRLALKALVRGKITVTALIDLALTAAEACKADLNAFSVVAHDSALAAAAESDQRLCRR